MTAVVVGAASLMFFVSGPAIAGQGDCAPSRAGLLAGKCRGGVRHGHSATCGKCHSTCENGRSHLGLSPPVSSAVRNCLSTPRDARPASPATIPAGMKCPVMSGAHLRISNLRRELCLACHRQDTAAGPGIEIVSPLERAVVQDERLRLSAGLPASRDPTHRPSQRRRVPPPGEGGGIFHLAQASGRGQPHRDRAGRAPALEGRAVPRRECPGRLQARLFGAPHRESGAMPGCHRKQARRAPAVLGAATALC